ncbi:hypothetical protein evm_005187 [Chilo suppressalis]|nr:hypothetical protein evm_005187 [Chilo suppressalis]
MEFSKIIPLFKAGEHYEELDDAGGLQLDNKLTSIPLKDKKARLFMYDGYTFSFGSKRTLRCSRNLRGNCTVRLTLNDAMEVSYIEGAHNHPAPKYYKTLDGYYIKIK